MMKQLLKNAMYSLAPQWTASFMAARARAHSHRVIAQWGCLPLNKQLTEKLGHQVLEGPFAGMTMTPMTHCEQLGPFLLGVYESELEPAWEKVLRRDYRTIIDVGSKFGYYAVGLARRYPNARVLAYDIDPWAKQATMEMSSVNGTTNLEVRGFCSTESLGEMDLNGSLILSDCEGYELNLFQERVIPKLKDATLIIETHDCIIPRVSHTLQERFSGTHDVQVFGNPIHRRKTSADLSFVKPELMHLAEHEVRPEQEWLLCLPRSRS
ncbi:MAG: hypothetical protein ACRC8S_22190 [Fimbriiglobus sp.]